MLVKKHTAEGVNLDITGVTLLSIEEAEELPFKFRKYTSRWWLRSPGYNSYYAAFVYSNGSVDDFGDYVDLDSNMVRPALQIKNLESSNLKIGDVFYFGGKPFEVISNNLSFCLDCIGFYCFRRDCEASDANDYNKSDVKKYVDDWFNQSVQEAVR